MATKTIEVTEFTEAKEQIEQDKLGKLQSKVSEEEAGGRAHYWRVGVCPRCGFIGRYWYDTRRWHGYVCESCGAHLVG